MTSGSMRLRFCSQQTMLRPKDDAPCRKPQRAMLCCGRFLRVGEHMQPLFESVKMAMKTFFSSLALSQQCSKTDRADHNTSTSSGVCLESKPIFVPLSDDPDIPLHTTALAAEPQNCRRAVTPVKTAAASPRATLTSSCHESVIAHVQAVATADLYSVRAPPAGSKAIAHSAIATKSVVGREGEGHVRTQQAQSGPMCDRAVQTASWHITARSVLPSRERSSREGGTHRRLRPRRSPRRRQRCPLTAACRRTSPSPADSTSIRLGPTAQCSLTSQ